MTNAPFFGKGTLVVQHADQQRIKAFRAHGAYTALPEVANRPAHAAKFAIIGNVTFLVPAQFRHPVFPI